ncbi:MAG TPA: hypothetical protein VG937_01465 [Polyangiaceae bacterium]|nr:hypothetical protein [Polyangiaceae bacterium]
MAHFSRCAAFLLTLCAGLCFGCAPAQPAEDPAAESASADPNTPDSSGQSYAQAIATVCDVARLSAADANDPLEAANRRNEYLVQHVKNADGIYFLTVFRTQTAAEQAEALTREAKVAKLSRCALGDSLRAEAPASEAPAPSAAK